MHEAHCSCLYSYYNSLKNYEPILKDIVLWYYTIIMHAFMKVYFEQ
jgi:hypothetical protein